MISVNYDVTKKNEYKPLKKGDALINAIMPIHAFAQRIIYYFELCLYSVQREQELPGSSDTLFPSLRS